MISSDVRLSADEDRQTSARAAMMKDRSTCPPCALAATGLAVSLTGLRPRKRLQPRVYRSDVLLYLGNRLKFELLLPYHRAIFGRAYNYLSALQFPLLGNLHNLRISFLVNFRFNSI